MNVTLQTNNFNSQYNKYKNSNYSKLNGNISYNKPTFKGGIEIPTESKLLNPFNKAMDNFTTWIAKHYTAKLYESGLARFLAKKTDKLNSIVDHMQVMGSVIISGMYMTQTLRNKKLDEDRRRTLAINQGLTFLVSTIGSYIIDDALDSKWEKLTLKYAQKQTDDLELGNKIAKLNKELKEKYDAGILDGSIEKGTKFRAKSVLDYVSDNLPNTGLEKRLRGMGVLKKLIVFGTIYRFISPVLVTPIANVVGDKLVHLKNKTTNNTKKPENEVNKK